MTLERVEKFRSGFQVIKPELYYGSKILGGKHTVSLFPHTTLRLTGVNIQQSHKMVVGQDSWGNCCYCVCMCVCVCSGGLQKEGRCPDHFIFVTGKRKFCCHYPHSFPPSSQFCWTSQSHLQSSILDTQLRAALATFTYLRTVLSE